MDSSRITWNTTVRVTTPRRFRPTQGGRRLNWRCGGGAAGKALVAVHTVGFASGAAAVAGSIADIATLAICTSVTEKAGHEPVHHREPLGVAQPHLPPVHVHPHEVVQGVEHQDPAQGPGARRSIGGHGFQDGEPRENQHRRPGSDPRGVAMVQAQPACLEQYDRERALRKSPRRFPRVDQRPQVAEQCREETQSHPEGDVDRGRRRVERGAFVADQGTRRSRRRSARPTGFSAWP